MNNAKEKKEEEVQKSGRIKEGWMIYR